MGRKDCKLPDDQSIEMGFSSFFKKINQLLHFFGGFFFCIFVLLFFFCLFSFSFVFILLYFV